VRHFISSGGEGRLCVRVDERLAHLVDDGRRALALELCGGASQRKGGQWGGIWPSIERQPQERERERRTKGGLDDGDLGRGRVDASEGAPIVDDQAGAEDVGTAVDGSSDERHLEQRAQLLLLAPARLGVDEAALVGEGAVAADEDVGRDRLPEDLDLEDVGDDLLGLAVDVRVDEGDIVVARDDVAEGRQPLLDPLDRDRRRERVADVLELLVGARRREEETVPVAWSASAPKRAEFSRGEERERQFRRDS
jgi:hypothetical protein